MDHIQYAGLKMGVIKMKNEKNNENSGDLVHQNPERFRN